MAVSSAHGHGPAAVGRSLPPPEHSKVTAGVVTEFLAANQPLDNDIRRFLSALVKGKAPDDTVDLLPMLKLDQGNDKSRTRHVLAVLLVRWHKERLAGKITTAATSTPVTTPTPASDDSDDAPSVPGQLRTSLFNTSGVGNISGADNLSFNLPTYAAMPRAIDSNPIVAFVTSDAGTASRLTLNTAASLTSLTPALFLTDKLSLQADVDWSNPGSLAGGLKFGGHDDVSADQMPGIFKNNARAYLFYGGGAFSYSPSAYGLSAKPQAVAVGGQAFGRIESVNENLVGSHLQFRLGADLNANLNITSDNFAVGANSLLRPGSDATLLGQEKIGKLSFQWATGLRGQVDILGQPGATVGVPLGLSLVYQANSWTGHLEVGGSKIFNAATGDPNETHYALLAAQPKDGKFSVGILAQGSSMTDFQAINSLGIAASYTVSTKLSLGLGAAVAADSKGNLDFKTPQLGILVNWSP